LTDVPVYTVYMVQDSSKTTVISLRIEHEVSDRIDSLAARMNVTRSELLQRIVRNGTDDLGGIVEKCENPIINLGLKIAVNLAANEEERQQILDQLDSIAQHRKERNQQQLPGMA